MMTAINMMTKANFDSSDRDPKQARGELAANVDYFNWLAGVLNGGSAGLPLVSPGGGNAPEYAKLGTDGLADGCVTEGQLANDAVSTSRIQDGAVTASKISNTAIGMDQLDNGPVGGIIRFNGSSRPVVEAQYQGRCFAYVSSDQAISAGGLINWMNRLYDGEGVYAGGVVFVASRAGLWRFNATIQLSTSSIVRFVVAGSRYYDFQANGTQATCITLDVLLSSNDQAPHSPYQLTIA